ncbi:hypothetical protein FRC14_008027 [Serendipita sp. 396]|nr:hypothetical protein FRC14_008027 [Serendipita sp. 396]KAG8775754.1 hypothetical protein FRC15_000338 [Serendipita sp. 397]KAG8841161.1 hypothetical protein FRC20_005181 [Serendipita sp. 405]
MARCTSSGCGNYCDDDLLPTLACNHELNLCSTHIKRFIRSNIAEAHCRIKCPQANCQTLISDADVERCIDEKDLPKFIQLCLQDLTRDHPDFTMCPTCGAGQYHLGGNDAPIVTCESCFEVYCFKDKIHWTDDHSCDNYGTHSGARLPNDVKACPNCTRHMKRVAG